MSDDTQGWISLEKFARDRGYTKNYMRDMCKRLGVVLLGTRKNPAIKPAEYDAALDKQRRAIAANDADFAQIERAKLPTLKVKDGAA